MHYIVKLCNYIVASTQIADAVRLPATFAGGSYNALSCSMVVAGVFTPAGVYVAALRLRCAARVVSFLGRIDANIKKPF